MVVCYFEQRMFNITKLINIPNGALYLIAHSYMSSLTVINSSVL